MSANVVITTGARQRPAANRGLMVAALTVFAIFAFYLVGPLAHGSFTQHCATADATTGVTQTTTC